MGLKLHPGGGFFGPWSFIIYENSHQDITGAKKQTKMAVTKIKLFLQSRNYYVGLIGWILPDQPKLRQISITKPLTFNKHLSLLYLLAQFSSFSFGSTAKSLRTIAQRFCDFDLQRTLVRVDSVVEIQDRSRVPQCVLG